jgi:beta-alanine degradation protein BauB
MRTRLTVIAIALSAPLTLGAQPTVTQASRSRDAVAVDPAHHQVLFENEHVRVIRGMVNPGDRSPMHTHPATLIVSLGTSRSRATMGDGTTGIFDFTPGQVLWMDGAEHAWQMLAGQGHLVGIEVKAAARMAPPAAVTLPATDAVQVDPIVHLVVLENAYVRVIEGLSGTGRKSPMHTHSRGGVLISLGRARLNMTGPDGTSAIVDLHPGQVTWLEPGAHSWEIVSGVSNVIVVEAKSATAK